MKRLATICARGGSKGVPGKNLRQLGGKSLLAHAIEQARLSELFEAIAVSSDSPDILAEASAWGAHVRIERPADLATDGAAKPPVIAHAVEAAEAQLNRVFDVVVDLAATSPLRAPADIVGAVDLLERHRPTNVITGMPARCSPYFNLVEKNPDGTVALAKKSTQAVVRRQDAPPCYDMNGAIYPWWRTPFLADPKIFYGDTLLFEMPESRSVDIDNELDVAFAEFLLQRGFVAST